MPEQLADLHAIADRQELRGREATGHWRGHDGFPAWKGMNRCRRAHRGSYLDFSDALGGERVRPLLFLEVRNGCGIVLELLGISDGGGLVGKDRDLAEFVSIDETRRIECDGPSVSAGCRQCALDAEYPWS